MGTNYYIRNRSNAFESLTHIGKRSNNDFLWAMTEEDFLKAFKETSGLIIVSDDSKIYGLYQFTEMIRDLNWCFQFVGNVFS